MSAVAISSPSDALAGALRRLADGAPLTADDTAAAFGVVMRGEATPAQVAALLMGLRARGESADELAGAARALREAMLPVVTGLTEQLVDTCGTGGGAVGTLNVSTAAAFVVAGAGVPVAKHGNRSYTSRCGSADVLEALGVDIGAAPERAATILAQVGLVFLFAPAYHPAMRHVGPTRKELGVPTLMNLVGPLVNPAGVRRQVIGVADRARAPLVAGALRRLDTAHALVVHGEIGMDEISPCGNTAVWEVRGTEVGEWTIDPATLGLATDDPGELAGGEPPENAARIERLLACDEDRAARAAVLLNAGAALYVAGRGLGFADAVRAAERALEDGRAARVLAQLRRAAPRA
ncbi:MAG TPA: anthranilate phosphoribosyltransferase [Gemmatimonadales bacterium]|nr:anthranilate phosphoribosyltransferase [Gemmatimonadales bacterium]